MIDVQQILKAIEAHVRGWIQEMGGTPGSGGYAPKPHDLSSDNHTGSISDAQGPQFLKTDGSRMLTGNQTVAAGATIDGVDVSELGSTVGSLGTQVSGLASDFSAHDGATATAAHTGGVGNHNHQSSGAQGGPLDHGAAMTGLGDDDHPHYLLANGTRAVAGNLVPDATDARDLGAVDRLWRRGWLSELSAVVFAENAQTLVGGYLIVGKGQGTLAADTSAGAVSIDFGQAMIVGDFILLRAAGQVEYMRVGALVSGTTYSVTRNLDGSGANAWPKGSVYLVLGQDGAGRIVLNAVDTPRIQILRQGNGYNLNTEVARLGDMNGAFGIGSEEYGFGVGDYAGGNYLRYGPTSGFKLKGGNGAVNIDESGIDIAAFDGEFPSSPNSVDFIGVDGIVHTRFYGSYDQSYKIVRSMLTSENAQGGNGTDITILANATKNLNSGVGTHGQAKLRAQSRAGGSEGANDNYAEVVAHSWVSVPSDPNVTLFVNSVNGSKQVLLNRLGFQVDNKEYLHMQDGWAPAGETWTYASATTFTVAGDVRSKYPVGTKIKLTQTTVKYFYVVATSYASPNTTVTITGGSDYSLANAAISQNYLSYMETPQGFPVWFNWTPVWQAVTTNPVLNNGILTGVFSMHGRKVTMQIDLTMGSTTTYGSGAWRFLVPIVAGSLRYYLGTALIYDASPASQAMALAQLQNVSYVYVYPSNSLTAINPTVPHTWAAGDVLRVQLEYFV